MQTVIVIAAVVSCGFWWLISIRTIRTQRKVPWLAESSVPELSRWPRVSLIIPACNEASTLEVSVTSRLSDDYPNLEVILVDDRSTDGTGGLVDTLAERDPRLIPVHVTKLPEGWLGKLHALHQGFAKATGEWLLFSDADVEFAKGTLRAAVAHCESRAIDHLVALPRVRRASLILDATIDTFFGGMIAVIDFAAVEDSGSRAAIGGGTFSMVRRTTLERSAGFEWLKLEVADDVALGQMLKRLGARQSMVNASKLISLHWYDTLREMTQGLEKNIFGVLGQYRIAHLLIALSLMLVLSLGPFAGTLLAPALWARALCIATVVGGLAVKMRFNHWLGRSIVPVILFPLGAILMAAIALRAGILAVWRGGIVWRGTFYPTELLRENMRFELF